MKKLLLILFLFIISNLHSEIIFQDFDDISKFQKKFAKLAAIQIESIKGYKNKCVKIDFDLTKDHFVEIWTPAEINIKNIHEFTWFLKGNANGNVFEIKFVDEDGTTFGKKLPISGIKEDEWKKFTLPIKELHYLWGGKDQNVDKITSFYIAISRGIAQKGYVLIDEFCYSEKQENKPTYEIHLNQVGYHPTDKKFFIARIYGVHSKEKISGKFKIKNKNNKTIISRKLKNTYFTDWEGQFLKGTFDELKSKGEYYIEVTLKIKNKNFTKNSYPFEINKNILSLKTLLPELNYLQYQRCGVKCHKKDPIMGGYHDTFFDISKRMWSIPALTYGMGCYVLDGPFHPDKNKDGKEDDMDELLWGFKFLSEIPEPDGTVSWGGIEADFKKVMTHEQFIARIGPLKPEDDDLPRIKYKDKNLYSTSYNLIALISSIPAIKNKTNLAKKAEIIALKAWEWLDKKKLSKAIDYGFYIWAAAELYKYTGDKKFLHKIDKVIPKLLQLQALNYNQFENFACGDFYTSSYAKDFRYQYKYVSFNIAINMALLNLIKILPKGSPLWFDVYYANKVFGENYLKGIASKTPYKQASHGLESLEKTKTAKEEKLKLITDFNSSIDVDYQTEDGINLLCLNFDLSTGNWAQINKKIKNDLSGLVKIKFKYKYNGQKNILKFMFTDSDNSTFGYKKTISPTNNWTIEEINFSQLKYMWGGDRKLDLSNLDAIWFTVSKIQGGKGSLYLKEVELIKDDLQIVKVSFKDTESQIYYKLNYFAGAEAKGAAADNHGLNCDHLGLAFIAMKWGQIINDLELEEFADNQVNWVLGENPLDYCMLIGVGSKNPVIMAEYFGKPKLAGIIPNGIVGGKNEEPEWWGDTPSSGEDWLPHNAAYLALLSILDNPAEIKGKVLLKGKPVSKATIEIFDKKKRIARVKTDKKGKFKPITLAPQKQYKIVIKKGKRKITENINLLSGCKKDIIRDLNRNFTLKIISPKKIKINKKNIFQIKMPKKALGQKYQIRVKGAEIQSPKNGKIKTRNIKVTLVPEGNKPLLFRFEILGKPIIYKEVYFKSL